MARKTGRVGMEQAPRSICTVIFSGLFTLNMFASLPHRTQNTIAPTRTCFLISVHPAHEPCQCHKANSHCWSIWLEDTQLDKVGCSCSGSPAYWVRFNGLFRQKIKLHSYPIFLPPISQQFSGISGVPRARWSAGGARTRGLHDL